MGLRIDSKHLEAAILALYRFGKTPLRSWSDNCDLALPRWHRGSTVNAQQEHVDAERADERGIL
jgi:hypothetical protein